MDELAIYKFVAHAAIFICCVLLGYLVAMKTNLKEYLKGTVRYSIYTESGLVLLYGLFIIAIIVNVSLCIRAIL